ncbi:MAG TPA: RsmE family RNA methyltransferase [Chloroflexia bacterium]|nr:RsmE family RNA methyltransferase [Chloroflexia bacterium]
MHRFYVSPAILIEAKAGQVVILKGEIAQQITRVLRMREGDEIWLFDGGSYEYRTKLVSISKDEVGGELATRRRIKSEPLHPVDLYLSLLNKPDKFEWALQKCTELGASRFVPVIAERSVSNALGANKRERWERIIQEAVEQSGRGALPILEDAVSLTEALNAQSDRMDESGTHVALMPALGADLSLGDALADANNESGSVSIFIGPEGGFSDDELLAANERGVQLVNLGPRTLRAETAAAAALAMTLYELGEMGQPKIY